MNDLTSNKNPTLTAFETAQEQDLFNSKISGLFSEPNHEILPAIQTGHVNSKDSYFNKSFLPYATESRNSFNFFDAVGTLSLMFGWAPTVIPFAIAANSYALTIPLLYAVPITVASWFGTTYLANKKFQEAHKGQLADYLRNKDQRKIDKEFDRLNGMRLDKAVPLIYEILKSPHNGIDSEGQTKPLSEIVFAPHLKQSLNILTSSDSGIQNFLCKQDWFQAYMPKVLDMMDVSKITDKELKFIHTIGTFAKDEDVILRAAKFIIARTDLALFTSNVDQINSLSLVRRLLKKVNLTPERFEDIKASILSSKHIAEKTSAIEQIYREHYKVPVVTKDIEVITSEAEIIAPSRALTSAEQIEKVRANLMSAETARLAVDQAIKAGDTLSLIDLGDDLFRSVTHVLASINQDSASTLNAARDSMFDLMKIPAQARERDRQLAIMLDRGLLSGIRRSIAGIRDTFEFANEANVDFSDINAKLVAAQSTSRNFIEKNGVLAEYGQELVTPLTNLYNALQETTTGNNTKDLSNKQFEQLGRTRDYTQRLMSITNNQIAMCEMFDTEEARFYSFLRELGLSNATAGLTESLNIHSQKQKMRETLSADIEVKTRRDLENLRKKITELETAFNDRSQILDKSDEQLTNIRYEIEDMRGDKATPIEIEIPIMRELARG